MKIFRILFAMILYLGIVELALGQSDISWEKQIIDNDLAHAYELDIADLNGDGNLDVLATGNAAHDVVWYEAPTWTKHTIDDNINGPEMILVIDIDKDEDLDVVITAWDANQVVIYKQTITNIEEFSYASPFIFQLNQNYPNPFNPSTTIEFTLPKSEYVELKVYNILGKEVTTLVSNKLNLGNHAYQFDGKNLASGIYYYQVVTGEYREVKKMILLK